MSTYIYIYIYIYLCTIYREEENINIFSIIYIYIYMGVRLLFFLLLRSCNYSLYSLMLNRLLDYVSPFLHMLNSSIKWLRLYVPMYLSFLQEYRCVIHFTAHSPPLYYYTEYNLARYVSTRWPTARWRNVSVRPTFWHHADYMEPWTLYGKRMVCVSSNITIFPSKLTLRISFSPVPECVVAECRNRVVHPPPPRATRPPLLFFCTFKGAL